MVWTCSIFSSEIFPLVRPSRSAVTMAAWGPVSVPLAELSISNFLTSSIYRLISPIIFTTRGPAGPQPLWIYQEEPKGNSRHASVP